MDFFSHKKEREERLNYPVENKQYFSAKKKFEMPKKYRFTYKQGLTVHRSKVLDR